MAKKQSKKDASPKKDANGGAAPHDDAPMRSAPFPGTGVQIAKPEFHDVRVHHPAYNKKDFGAKAFTTGNDIFLKDGAYHPAASREHATMAHELTHVIQQTKGR